MHCGLSHTKNQAESLRLVKEAKLAARNGALRVVRRIFRSLAYQIETPRQCFHTQSITAQLFSGSLPTMVEVDLPVRRFWYHRRSIGGILTSLR